MLGPHRPAAHKDSISHTAGQCKNASGAIVTRTVFVLQFVLLEGVAADGGYYIKSIQALSWLGLAHLTLHKSTHMLVALQQRPGACEYG